MKMAPSVPLHGAVAQVTNWVRSNSQKYLIDRVQVGQQQLQATVVMPIYCKFNTFAEICILHVKVGLKLT